MSASFTPSWKIPRFLSDFLAGDAEVTGQNEIAVRGSEFTIGVVRGSRRGGDWGVSFLNKPFTDGVVTTSAKQQCGGPPGKVHCWTETEADSLKGARLRGVEIHWFIGFVTIKDRVQIGLNIAGGVATLEGTITEVKDGEQFVSFNPNGPDVYKPLHTEETKIVRDEVELPVIPLIKVELEGSVIVTPALRIKVAAGLNVPGTGVRILGVYLFGVR